MKMLYPKLLILMILALPTAAAAQGAGYTEDRLNQLQQSISLLTGQIEQLQYKNQQLQQQMEKMQADYEYRLDQLEKGKGGGGPRPTAPPPGPPSLQPQAGAAPPPGPANAANGDQLYHDAFKMLQDGDYAGAEKAFKTFVQRNPQHVLAGNAQYWLGESFYVRGNYNEAAVAFAEGYQKYPTNVKAPQNLLKLAMSLTAMGRKPDACKAFDQLARQFPNAPADVKLRAGRERQNAGCPGA